MKQGGSPPTGKWIGNPQGGVTTPEALLLPNPMLRFSATADRMRALSPDHPMAKWLTFMADLSDAQHIAATTLAPMPPIDRSLIDRSVAGRIPPLAADGHHRNSAWRDGLALMLDALERCSLPAPARETITKVRSSTTDAIEDLADGFLRDTVRGADAGSALYVAAALQVYFTRLAGSLDASALRLLPQRGLCPCCGSTPVSGLITASGDAPGIRYLYCSLCSTAWNHVRAVCITCESSHKVSLKEIEGGPGVVKAEICDDCQTYAKLIYQIKDTKADPYADDLATLGLDIMVSEAGWARHAPNPMLLVG
ncbi:formate dehydrogenase accessory protein FdhE [Hyphomicrobium sp.]|uniref:formate dehydrogenase accessory protein FdhE n=1 Tax=Hyphomicrobium sp. TaxID=82 RepID=UPI001D6B78B1|nr:formate dehydrogenase accessory protein FdhE [Hyphomicrobium sp.]MBY0562209.1 formate dehydrogenase accessory protein FdhE [Hyphomicrobium sp.]